MSGTGSRSTHSGQANNFSGSLVGTSRRPCGLSLTGLSSSPSLPSNSAVDGSTTKRKQGRPSKMRQEAGTNQTSSQMPRATQVPIQRLDSMANPHLQSLMNQQQQNLMPPPKLYKSPSTPGWTFFSRLRTYLDHINMRPPKNTFEVWAMLFKDHYTPEAKIRCCLSCYDDGIHCILSQLPTQKEAAPCGLCGSTTGAGFKVNATRLTEINVITHDLEFHDKVWLQDRLHLIYRSEKVIVFQCEKAVQESIYGGLNVLRYGKLRITFTTQEGKIMRWEFSARRHLVAYHAYVTPQVIPIGSSAGESVELEALNAWGFSEKLVLALKHSKVFHRMKDMMGRNLEDKMTALLEYLQSPSTPLPDQNNQNKSIDIQREMARNDLMDNFTGTGVPTYSQMTSSGIQEYRPMPTAGASDNNQLFTVADQEDKELEAQILAMLMEENEKEMSCHGLPTSSRV